jgi:histidine triad (HIT) family protein
MNECIFCRIVKGELPCTKIFENDAVLAFMDIGPIIKGHVLIIPKAHYATLPEVPAELAAQVMVVVQNVAAALLSALSADGVNVHQSNGACAGPGGAARPFPRHSRASEQDDGHRWNWNAATTYESPAELLATADAIRHAHRLGSGSVRAFRRMLTPRGACRTAGSGTPDTPRG